MQIKSTKIVYECPIFKVEEREVNTNGVDKTFWVVVRAPNVNVIALTNEKKIVLVKEIIKGKEQIVLPGGKVETYEYTDEDVKKQALAELREEAGYKANNIKLLSKLSSPWNTFDREFYRYVAWDLEDVGQALEQGEKITRFELTIQEAQQIITDRKMTSPEEERTLESAITWFKEQGLL